MSKPAAHPGPRSIRTRDRVRYRIDNSLAKGIGPVIGLLAAFTVLVVVLAGLFLWFGHVRVNGDTADGFEGVWLSLVRTLDPGTMGADRGWRFRLTSLVVTVTGIFIVSTLIGLLANGISQRLDKLRRGRSRVIESDHVVVLGWSTKLFILVKELEVAAAGDAPPCVVVLANRDVVEMDEEIRLKIGANSRIRVVARSGDPTTPPALHLVAPLAARSIVILKDGDDGDALVVKAALALEHIGLDGTVPVVLEIDDARHAKALMMASSLNIHPVVPADWIAMITARAIQHPVLTDIYEDLLDFDGAELYFVAVDDSVVGLRIADVSSLVQGGVVLGLRREDIPMIGPDPDLVVKPHDQLVVIADEFRDVRISRNAAPAAESRSLSLTSAAPNPIHLLILGWSPLGAQVLELLDHSLPPRSVIEVVAPDGALGIPDHPFQRFELRHTRGHGTDPDVLERLTSSSTLTSVLVLSSNGPEISRHDAEALLIVLELRRILADRPNVQVTVEITDPANAEMVETNNREEFIVGERLVCLLMSQMSHTAGVTDVLQSLLADDEVTLSVIPANEIHGLGGSASAVELAQVLRDHGHYVIGAANGGRGRLTPNLGSLTLTDDTDLIVVSNEAVTQARQMART